MSAPASVRSAALAFTIASCAESAAKKLAAGWNGLPVSSLMCPAAVSPKRGSALSPVPTAVPPSASSCRPGSARAHGRERLVELRHPAGDDLAERDRRRVLQVRAADHHDAGELLRPCAPACRAAPRSPGSATSSSSTTAAMCITVGKVSLLDWPRLTSSLGWTGVAGAAARPASSIGAVRDHLVGVHVASACPMPVWKTTSGNSASSAPSMTSCGGAHDERRPCPAAAGRAPRWPAPPHFLSDAERADHRPAPAEARRRRWGSCSSERCVCAPQ